MFLLACVSVSLEYISCVYFLLDVVEAAVESVGNYGLRSSLELGKVVHYTAAEECGTVLKGGHGYYDLGALGLDALHYALD